MSKKVRGRPKGKGKTTSGKSAGNTIRRARLKLGLGLSDVAHQVGVSVQFISNIEHGRAPIPFRSVTALSKVLGVPNRLLALKALEGTHSYQEYTSLLGSS